ncbi:MAG: MarR family transcriptional regulator, partial [Halobaculum sp.]
MIGDERPDLETIKRMRRDHPSGWLELSMTPARALLIDAILDSPPGHEFTTGTISRRAGISAQAVRNHIDVLVDRGIVERTSETEYRVVDDSTVLAELERLNGAVTSVRSGVPQERTAELNPDRR